VLRLIRDVLAFQPRGRAPTSAPRSTTARGCCAPRHHLRAQRLRAARMPSARRGRRAAGRRRCGWCRAATTSSPCRSRPMRKRDAAGRGPAGGEPIRKPARRHRRHGRAAACGAFSALLARCTARMRRVFRRLGVDEIEVRTNESYVRPLLAFFRRRERQRRAMRHAPSRAPVSRGSRLLADRRIATATCPAGGRSLPPQMAVGRRQGISVGDVFHAVVRVAVPWHTHHVFPIRSSLHRTARGGGKPGTPDDSVGGRLGHGALSAHRVAPRPARELPAATIRLAVIERRRRRTSSRRFPSSIVRRSCRRTRRGHRAQGVRRTCSARTASGGRCCSPPLLCSRC
jgi:hypothetical protein